MSNHAGHVIKKTFCGLNAGWIAPEYNLMSWALSCLQLKKYHSPAVLYADTTAAKMLIDTLQLPYDRVICDLDKLNAYDPGLWALSKIYTYSRQTGPFLHVDSDVFIWQAFDDNLLNSGLIAQNLEVSTEYYEGVMKNLERNLAYIPSEIIQDRKTNPLIYAYNAGILGGCDIDFIQSYVCESFRFVNTNTDVLSKINRGTFNIFFEQYLFYCRAKKQDKPVNVLIQDVIGDNAYTGFDDFAEVPHNIKYLHLLGTYKRHKTVCQQMADRLRCDYPEYYYRIISLYKNRKIPLVRDCYYSISLFNEKDFVSRYNNLKDSFANSELEIKNDSKAAKPELKLLTNTEVDELATSAEKSSANTRNVKATAYKARLNDAQAFKKKLNFVVQKSFVNYADEYLYGRDIMSTAYHQYIFNDTNYILEKRVVADSLIAVIKSRFDWSKTNLENMTVLELIKFSEHKPIVIYTAVVPEPGICGYSLINIDRLDSLLLNILKTPKTIADVLHDAKCAFDPIEVQECNAEFELLIIGRIKTALKFKLIKAIME